jgi:hypothetical protein
MAFLDLQYLDRIQGVLEGYLHTIQSVRTQVETLQSATATTSRRRKKSPNIPTQQRSQLEKALRSFITEAETVLESILPTPRAAKTNRSSKGRAHRATENTAQRSEELVQRLRSRVADEHIQKSTGKRTLRSKARPPMVDEHTTEDEDTGKSNTDNDDTEDEEGNDMISIDNSVGTYHEPRKSSMSKEPSKAMLPLALDRSDPDSTAVFAVPTHQCELSDLGLYTATTMERFTCLADVRRTGMCHLQVKDCVLKSLDFDHNSVQAAKCTTTALKYNRTFPLAHGVMGVSSDISQQPAAPRPNFADVPRTEYSDREMEAVFESFCQPDSSVTSGRPQWYLIGPSEEVLGEQCRYSDLLSAGPYMQQALTTVIEGVNSSYIYASYSPGQTATALHYEDCQWYSVNLMRCGAPKLWLSVEPASNEDLEAGLEAMFPEKMTTCSQRVRHLSVFLAPSVLKRLGVKYHIKACYPGELIFTTPASYHQIVNMGANMAEAINFMDSKIPAHPTNYVFCSGRICNTNQSIGLQHFRSTKRPWLNEEMPNLPNKKKRKDNVFLDVVQLQRYSLGAGERLFHNLVRGSFTSILVSVLSKKTLARLSALISAQRMKHHDDLRSGTLYSSSPEPRNFARLAAAHHGAAECSLQQADLPLLRARVNSYAYVSLLEEKKGDTQKLPSYIVDDILREKKVPVSLNARHAFIRDFSTNRKWLTLCRLLGPGLLALLPLQSGYPYFLCTSILVKMTESDIVNFDALTKEMMNRPECKVIIEKLCCAANGLVKRVIRDTVFQYGLANSDNDEADFEYSSEWLHGTTPLFSEDDDFDLEETLSLFQPRPYLTQTQPAEDTDLRFDPALVSGACSSCIRDLPGWSCSCLRTLRLNACQLFIGPPGQRPAISSRMAFSPGDCIGELTGLLHRTDHDGCSGTFCALSEIGTSGPPICHLHWEDHGNWVRHVPHSCVPCAEFKPQILACRLRVMLRAKSAIATGADITVDWSLLSGNVRNKLQECISCVGPCAIC